MILRRRARRSADARERERLFGDAQALAHVGSWEVPPGRRRAWWSDELCAIFGQPRGSTPTREEFIALVHPDDRPRVLANMRERSMGDGSVVEYRILRPDGEVRHVRALRHAHDGGEGRLDHVFGTIQDITDRRRSEFALQRERDFASLVLRAMHDGFMLTRNGRILQVNDALCALTGFTREELIGATVPYPFWAPEAMAEIEASRAKLAAGKLRSFEGTYMRKDGTRLAVSVSTDAARGQDGVLLGYVSTVRDISEQKRHQAELERLASQDHLTGLLNHRVFHERLHAEVARARRNGRPLSVALLDLDHFKSVNDRHGHLTGDRVLREAARRLATLVRDGEHLARVGGEEFGWILPDAEAIGAIAATERARRAVGSRPFAGLGLVTLSAGVCELADAGDAEQLYRRADQALYWAKQHGRDCAFRYSSATAAELLSELPPAPPAERE